MSPLQPFSINLYDNSQKLNVECYISTSPMVMADDGSLPASGSWLDLNDQNTFRLAKGSFEETSIQYRKDEITNPYLEGSYVLNALRQNTAETVVVYVVGETTADVQEAVKKFTDALSQSNFWVRTVIENSVTLWRCYAAEYTISTPVEFIHARRATVKAVIPRDPNEYVSEVV